MSDAARGILIIAILGFVGAGYYYGFYLPSQAAPEVEIPGTVANYLDIEPITPDPDTLPEELFRFMDCPSFTYYTMDNQRISLSDYKGEKKVVLFFWRSWNQSCRDELYVLQKFWLEYRNEVEVIAINCEETDKLDDVKEILDDKDVQFPVIHDPSEKLRGLYFHETIPYFVLVDKDGKYVDSFVNTNYELEDIIMCTFDPMRKSESGVRTPSTGSGCGSACG